MVSELFQRKGIIPVFRELYKAHIQGDGLNQSELTEKADVSRSAMHNLLKELQYLDLIETKRVKQAIIYTLKEPRGIEFAEKLDEAGKIFDELDDIINNRT